ncbi:FecR family protein [Bordetella genomosp. 12]|uniref:FecR family protein n=1 Tax=Bordetella genomosp. 12 TaxID=463035 RepID=UPI001FC971C4|nr:FecR domain-containing protein [Bordetella genomosp. 12]
MNDRPASSSSAALANDEAREFATFAQSQDALTLMAASWQVRRQDGLSAGEEAEFQQWLAEAPAHQAAFDQLDTVWRRLASLPAADVSRLGAAPRPTPAAPARPARRAARAGASRLFSGMAAAGVALAVAGAAWIGWHQWLNPWGYAHTYVTARGQQLEVRLPDGSTLQLDTATRADVRLTPQRREVLLPEGQALFQVQPDAGRPFDVLAGPLRITVVGTRFSVRNTQTGLDAGSVNVVVEEGRVRVAPALATGATPPGAVELTAGQSIRADAAGHLGPVTAQAPGGLMPWREHRANFESTPLALALAEFERYAATGLTIDDPNVAALRVNGSFDLRQAGAFAKALPQVLPVRLVKRQGSTEIVSAP